MPFKFNPFTSKLDKVIKKYTNAEAIAAMGAKADDNPLHHDKYELPASALHFYPITPIKIMESLGIGDSPHTTLITALDAGNNRVKITTNTHKPYNVQNGYSKMEIRNLTHPTTNAWVLYTLYSGIPPFFDTYLYLDSLPGDWAIGDTITDSFAASPSNTARIELLTVPANTEFAYFLAYVRDPVPANTVYTSLSYPSTGFTYIYLKPQVANLELMTNCIIRLTDNQFWLKTLASNSSFSLSIKLLGYFK